MRISDWSSDVCSSDLDAAASRFARTANRLRRAALMSLLPLPKLGALASGQCQLQLRQTICARVTPSWRLTNYSASQKRRCPEYTLGSGSLPIGNILRLSNHSADVVRSLDVTLSRSYMPMEC